METLSSSLTFFYKFVVASAIVLGSALFGLVFLLPGGSESWAGRVAGVAVAAVIGVLIWSVYGTVKRVELNGSMLEVSNYRDTISIPVADIVSVTEDGGPRRSLRVVTITLRHPTQFGDVVEFVPRFSLAAVYSEHPVVKRLRDLACSGGLPSSAQQARPADSMNL